MKKQLKIELVKLALSIAFFVAVCVGSYFLLTGVAEVLF